MREVEHLSHLTIAFQFVQAEVRTYGILSHTHIEGSKRCMASNSIALASWLFIFLQNVFCDLERVSFVERLFMPFWKGPLSDGVPLYRVYFSKCLLASAWAQESATMEKELSLNLDIL